MATKPTKRILDWASGGTKTDPGAAKEAAGWLTSDRPPAQWWNWVLSSFGDWLTYFDQFTPLKVIKNLAQYRYSGVSYNRTGDGSGSFPLRGISFTDGGNRMYWGNSTALYDYTLSTPYDISTLSYVKVAATYATTPTLAYDVVFSDNQTTFFVLGSSGVYEWELDAAGGTGTFVDSFTTSTQDSAARGLTFSKNGEHFYLVGQTNNTIYQYDCPTAWDLTGCSYSTNSFLATGQDTSPLAIQIYNSGTSLIIGGSTNDTFYEYELTTAYDISTAVYTGNSVNYSGTDNSIYKFTVTEEGSHLIWAGAENFLIYQSYINSVVSDR